MTEKIRNDNLPGGICFDLPFPPKELSPNVRVFWKILADAKKAYRAAGYYYCLEALHGAKPKNVGKVQVTFTFYPPDRRQRDKDNLLFRMKSGIDGIADALGFNDRIFEYEKWTVAEPIRYGKVAVHLTFLPIDGG